MDNYHSTNAGAGDAEAATPVSPPTESDLSPRPSWRRRLWLKILGLPRRTRLRLIAGAGALALLALIAALVAIVLTVYSWATGPRLIYYQRASDKSTRIDELRIGAEGLRGDFRPRDASFPGDRLVSGLIFEPLIAMGPDGLPENILAEAVEISADGLTYTVRLRRGVKFQEGQTLDAEDVNASVLSLAGQSTPFEGYLLGLEGYEAYINGSAGTIAGVRAPDARTISFTFRFARPENIWLLGMGIQQKESASLRDGPLNGTGPYRFARYDAARSSVELTAHDKYRAGRPAARQLLIAEVGAGEAAAAFRAGDINVFARSYDPAALREL
ncbi:MAG: ABC transporter substrate-binding protein, partial [Peptococcaceae bacterium]|nr:ABC transporter substrate-binding protein [Peptococcaceae bacterium]